MNTEEALDDFMTKYEGKPVGKMHKSLISPFFNFITVEAGKDLKTFEPVDVLNYLKTEHVARLTPYTRRQIVGSIKTFCRHYFNSADFDTCEVQELRQQQRRLTRITDIKLPAEFQARKRRAFTLPEWGELLGSMREVDEEDFVRAYLMGYFGFRPVEWRSIQGVDGRKGSITVLTAKITIQGAKTSRTLYYNKGTSRLLKSALEEGLFDLSGHALWRTLKKYRGLFRNKDLLLTPYSARHTFVTAMRPRLPPDGNLLRHIAGQKPKTMLDTYTTAFQSEVKDAFLNHHYYDDVRVARS